MSVGLYLADVHSGVRQVVDLTGTTVYAAERYDAFGVTVASPTQPGFVNVVGYQGERFDIVTGQYYLRARLYDAATGRFTAMDPFEGQLVNPITLHRYLFGGGDGINKVDPSGQEFSVTVFGVTITATRLVVAGIVLTAGLLVFATIAKIADQRFMQ